MPLKKTKKRTGAYDENKIDSERIVNLILNVLFTILSKSKHASIIKMVLRVILGKSLKKRFLKSKDKNIV